MSETYDTPQNVKHLLFSFKGRITRKQFWFANLVFILPVLIIGGFAAEAEADWFVILAAIYYLWAATSIVAKRYHDRDKSGWNQLLALIPILGAIIVLVEVGFLKGTDGPNRYGAVPKGMFK